VSTLLATLGLYLLRVDYVLLLGLLIGLFDVLPVLGPGTLLVPWALVSFLERDSRVGWGLLLIYAVILVSRQIVEPKIIASGLGLHPLAALAAGFVGLQIFGAFGLLLGPLLASLAYFIWGEYRSLT
jgi:predicted PurR-regulated permease PerM